MDDVRLPAGTQPSADVGRGHATARRSAAAVVGPVPPVGAEIGTARRGRRDAARRGRGGRARRRSPASSRARAAEQVVESSSTVAASLEPAPAPPDSRAAACASRRHAAASAAGRAPATSARPAGLDQREDFRGDGQDLQAHQSPSRSIIGWVIRQMPLSVRRKRLASSSGSSPTTRPSGMRDAAVDDDVAAAARARPIVDVGQHHRVVERGDRS